MAAPSQYKTSSVARYLARSHDAADRVETPAQGKNSEVFLITDPSGSRSVVRAFETAREGRHYIDLMRRFGGRELPLPRLLWSDVSLVTRLRYGRCFCAEEFVPGPLLMDVRAEEEAIVAVLRALAQLHDEISPEWGKPGRQRSDDIRQHWLAECLRWMEAIPEDSPLAAPGDRERWIAFLSAAATALPAQTQFSLIHGKIGTDDIVVTQGMLGATFLDNGSLSFGHFAHDLLYLLEQIAFDDQPRRRKLVDQYLGMRKRLPSGFDYERIEPFFAARHHVRKLRAAHRHRGSEVLEGHPRIRFHYDSLSALARSV